MSKRKRRCRATLSVKATRRKLMQLLGLDLNVHHVHHPRRAFLDDPIAKQFRELPCHRVIIPVDDHMEIHRNQPQPQMPSRQHMEAKLNDCYNAGCSRQGCTKPIKLACDPARIDVSALPPTVVPVQLA